MSVELTGITWEHARGFDCMVAAAEEWRRSSGVTVRWQQRSLQAFADQPLQDLIGDHDLLVIDHPHVPLAARNGYLLPLDDGQHVEQLQDLARHSVGASHVSYRYEGRQWALATDAAAQVSAYRPDLLERPPRTWAEVLELAVSGQVLWPAKPIDAFSSLLALAAVGSKRAATAAGPVDTRVMDQDGACAALELLHRLSGLVPPACLTMNPIEVAEQLATGDRWSYAPMLFGYSNYSRSGYRQNRLRYIDAPETASGQLASLLGGAGIAVSAETRHPDLAKDFAYWVADASVQTGVYFDAGGQPGHAAAWENQRLNAATCDFFSGTRPTLEAAYLRPRSPRYIAYQEALSPRVTACLRGDVDDDALITELVDGAAHLFDAETSSQHNAAPAHDRPQT